MKLHIVLIAALLTVAGLSVSAEPTVDQRLAELRGLESPTGTWEGAVDVVHMPAFGEEWKGEPAITVKLELGEDDAALYLGFEPGAEPRRLEGNVHVRRGLLGWTVQVERSGGVWVEKFVLTFSRRNETESFVTLLRTVHNWYTGGVRPDAEFFSVYGSGMVRRSASSQ